LFNLYFYSLIDDGKWASIQKGQVVQGNNSFIIWALSVDDVNFFQTLKTQINETREMVPNSLIWAFPKSEIFRYDALLSLLRTKLADNIPQRYRVVVCDPNIM